jgi:hypothetical protein
MVCIAAPALLLDVDIEAEGEEVPEAPPTGALDVAEEELFPSPMARVELATPLGHVSVFRGREKRDLRLHCGHSWAHGVHRGNWAGLVNADGLFLGTLVRDNGYGGGAAVVEESVQGGTDRSDVFVCNSEGCSRCSDLLDEVSNVAGLEVHVSGWCQLFSQVLIVFRLTDG